MIRILALPLFGLMACNLAPLASEAPPLLDWEAPLARQSEPDDEVRRQQLAAGSFTGISVESAWFERPDEPGQAPDALEIIALVENSPALAAGLRVGDLLLSTRIADGTCIELRYPSQWRKIETDTEPGTALRLSFDRAGVELHATIDPVARISLAHRQGIERFREEQRAGIILRTATEVEARKAGLGAGGGAVLIGMASNSPWRKAGLRFGDLIVAINGLSIDHPQVILTAIRTAADDARLEIDYLRMTENLTATIQTTERVQEISKISLQPLYSYRSSRGKTSISFLLGLFSYESTPVAWNFGFLWLFSFEGGDSDRLAEVGK